MLTKDVEKLKILSFIDDQQINCVAYGPFDNGHILIGLSDGWVLAYEYPSLERVESQQVFMDNEDDQSGGILGVGDIAESFTGMNMRPNNTLVLDSYEESEGSEQGLNSRSYHPTLNSDTGKTSMT